MLASEITQKLLIAVVSLLAGYAVGRYRREATMNKPRAQRLRDIGSTILGVIIVVAVGLTVYQVQVDSAEQKQQAQCFSAFAVASAEAINDRSRATGTQNQQFLDLVDGVLAGKTSADTRATLQAFRDSVARSEAARAASPLPPPPRCDQ